MKDRFYNGQRVALHPATDWWMRGVRFATVEVVGRESLGLQADNGKRFLLLKSNAAPVAASGQAQVWE